MNCYLCEKPLGGLICNWKGHKVHLECADKAATYYRPVPRQENPSPVGPVGPDGPGPGPKGQPGYPIPVPNYHVPYQGKLPPLCPAIGALGQTCQLPVEHPGDHYFTLPEELPPKIPQWDVKVNPDQSVTVHIPKEDRIDATIAFVIMKLPKELVGPDCPDAGRIVSECRDICELLLTKNRAYGSSFAKPLGVFSKLSPVEAINARMDDKLARIKQAKDFSEDTELDLIGYLLLKRIAQKMEKEGKIDPAIPGTDKTVTGYIKNPDYEKAEGYFPGLEAVAERKTEPVKLPPGSMPDLGTVSEDVKDYSKTLLFKGHRAAEPSPGLD